MPNLVKQNIVEQNLSGYNKQFCVRRADVQNLSLVLLLSISNKFGRSASISRPNAKLLDVSRKPMTAPTHQHLLIFQAVLLVAQKPYLIA